MRIGNKYFSKKLDQQVLAISKHVHTFVRDENNNLVLRVKQKHVKSLKADRVKCGQCDRRVKPVGLDAHKSAVH